MDEPDQTIASAIAGSSTAPERDISFAAGVERLVRRRRALVALIQRAGTALILLLSASLATAAFALVRVTIGALGSLPLSLVMMTTLGAFTALLFREMAQCAIEAAEIIQRQLVKSAE